MAYEPSLNTSYALDVEIYMDSRAVVERLHAQAMGLDSFINSWLVNASYLVKKEMEARAPVGVAGSIGQGLSHNISDDINTVAKTATIGPNLRVVPYAAGVETGTRPHMPPVDALQAWADMKGLNVWAVAKSIEKKGTEPHPYVKPTYDAVQEPVAALFREGINQFVQETNNL